MRKRYEGLIRLLVLLLIVPMVVWKLGISRTVYQWRQYHTEQSQIELLGSMDKAPQTTTILYRDLLNSGDLLKVISLDVEENDLSVDLYVPYLTEIRGTATLRSAQIVLRGSFFSLLKMIHALEHDIPQVSLRSVEFSSSNNLREKEIQLRATLFVQQMTHIE